MKKIEAIIQPHKLDDVKEALKVAGVDGLTHLGGPRTWPAEGPHGGLSGSRVQDRLRPKVKLELVVPDSKIWISLIGVISDAARTGKIGDGKIFVSTIDDAFRIRNGEKGESAL